MSLLEEGSRLLQAPLAWLAIAGFVVWYVIAMVVGSNARRHPRLAWLSFWMTKAAFPLLVLSLALDSASDGNFLITAGLLVAIVPLVVRSIADGAVARFASMIGGALLAPVMLWRTWLQGDQIEAMVFASALLVVVAAVWFYSRFGNSNPRGDAHA